MNIKDNLFLLSQAINIDHQTPHVFQEYPTQDPYDYAKLAATTPVGMAGAGRYQAAYVNLVDGQMGVFRLTADGKLMTDASISIGSLTVNVTPTRWTKRFYKEVSVTNVDSTVTFIDSGTLLPFAADEVTISNDDIEESIWLNYGAAAVADADHDKVLAGEKYLDKVPTGDVHLISDVAGPITVRVWARAL